MAEKRLTRREMFGTLGGLALAGAFGGSRAFAADKKPNILFIMSDDHASHAMSCYGSRINKTPQIDRIATGGLRFENCFCCNSICGPSRAAILTGKHSHVNGFRTNGDRFDGSQQTAPKLLKAAGYQTAMIGKWHLVSDPTGFDHWNILPGQGAYHNPMFIEMGERKKHTGYVTDLITDFAIDWITKRDKTKPFFLMCHHKAPHRNWQPDDKHAKLYDDVDIPEPETFNDDYKTRGTAARSTTMTIENHLTKSDVKGDVPAGLTGQARKSWLYQRYIKDYLRCVASVDDNVGRLLDYLDKEGLADDTIVVYTSDQGFYLGDHGWYDKRFMYEESLRMPFVVRYPRAVKPGTVNRDLVQNTDFAPMFLDAAGLPTPPDMHGRSFLPLLRGETPKDWRSSIYYHYYEYPAVHSVKRHYGVRTLRHKLIHFYHDVDEWELFDLEKDPHELNNVYADPAYADVVKHLKAELARLRAELKVPEDTARGGAARPAGPPASGVQLHLNFDDQQTDVVADASDRKRRLENHGTTLAEGRKGKARQFDGKGAFIDLARNQCPAPHGTPITVSAWVKPAKPDGVVLAHGGTSWGYALHLEGGKPAFSTRVNDTLTTAAASDKLPEGWSHIAGHLAKGGQMTLFLNGRPAGTAKAPGLLSQDPHDNLQIGVDAGSPVLDETKSARFYGGLLGGIKLTYGDLKPSAIAEEAKG